MPSNNGSQYYYVNTFFFNIENIKVIFLFILFARFSFSQFFFCQYSVWQTTSVQGNPMDCTRLQQTAINIITAGMRWVFQSLAKKNLSLIQH